MKTKAEIAEELKELPSLYEQASQLYSHAADYLEKQGLLSPAEKDTLNLAEQAHREIAKAERDAKDSIPFPDYQASYPSEYNQLLTRQGELKKVDKRIHDILRVVYNLRVTRSWGMDSEHFVSKLNLSDLASKVTGKLRDMPDPIATELDSVDRSVESKARKGTKIEGIRHELYANYEHAQGEAASRVRATLLTKHQRLFAEEQRIKEELVRQQEERLKPIRGQIEALLTKALEGMEK